MKVILSRKGFDSESGGYASPILPDGRLLSLPIPWSPDSTRYGDIPFTQNETYFDLMIELNKKQRLKYRAVGDRNSDWHPLESVTECHLDPDIYYGVRKRHKDWRPLFGQSGAAQTHLNQHDVGIGDLFLFFGSFKKTNIIATKLRFDPSGKNQHIIFGYFQIGEIVTVSETVNIPEWMRYHSHASQSIRSRNNTIYVARETLSWKDKVPGAGPFSFNERLVLTKKGYGRSRWHLPADFRGISISYHDQNSWKEDYFQSTARGQEFVIQENDKVEEWARDLINECVDMHMGSVTVSLT